MTRVSVVIPYHHGNRDFVQQCFNSVIAQTFRNFEVLIVTNAPLPFVPEHEEVSVSILENKTDKQYPSAARNIGLNRAIGEYIKPLDSDDVLQPSHLNECVKVLDGNEDVGLVYTDYTIIDKNNQFLREVKAPDFDLSKFLEVNFVGGNTVMFRRNGFRFNEEMDDWEDYELWLQIAGKYRFFHIPKILASYRVHEGQRSKHIQHPDRNMLHIEERRKQIRSCRK